MDAKLNKFSDDYLTLALKVSAVRRGQTLLARRMSEILGKTILRQAIQSWTREKNRIRPALGTGLALARAAALVADELGIKQSTKSAAQCVANRTIQNAIIYRIGDVAPRKGWSQPTAEQYADAFSKLSEAQTKLLKIQFSCPGYAVTVKQLARLANFRSYNASNAGYGAAGRKVSSLIKMKPAFYWDKYNPHWWSMISNGCSELKEYLWVMRQEAVAACQSLGWSENTKVFLDPTEQIDSRELLEGGEILLTAVRTRERSEAAREECIRLYGNWSCQICGFDFEAKYGEIGKEFIHVHHLSPLRDAKGIRKVAAETDLIPVCPNCHSMLHRRTPCYTPNELRALLRK